MALTQAIGYAVQGIKSAEHQVEKAAQKIAGFSGPDADVHLPEDIVSIKLAKAAHQANVSMLRAAAEMEKETIDIIV
ncbi:MAG: hypothetical protein P9L99_15400 [Candidatus Lernaella stagnicola]|nr:hypothetical protein [Candidatus Lernaella stagnicola]